MLRPAGTWVLPPPPRLPHAVRASRPAELLRRVLSVGTAFRARVPTSLLPAAALGALDTVEPYPQRAESPRDPKGPAPTAGPRSRGWGWGWGDSFLSPSVSPSSLGAPGSPLRGSALDLGITGWMLRVAWGRGIPGSGVRTGEGKQGPRRALMCPRAPPGGHAPPQVRAKAREGVPPPLGVPSHLLRPTAWARAWRAGGREGQGEGGESHAEVR